jgi:hypothetical protein
LLHEEKRSEQGFGRADGWSRVGENGHAHVTKAAVRSGDPVVDDAGCNAGAAALRFCFDQRAKISKRHRHRRSRLVGVRDGPVRSARLEQAFDQRGRTVFWSIIKLEGVDRTDGPAGQHQAERLAG